MKTLASIGLAGALALSAIGTAATPAAAGGNGWRHGPPPPHHGHHPRGNNGGNAAVGALFGFTLGAIASQAFAPPPAYYYPPVPVYYPPPPPKPVYPVYPVYGNPGAAWCAQQYASFNPATNTWVDYSGVVHVCYGPAG